MVMGGGGGWWGQGSATQGYWGQEDLTYKGAGASREKGELEKNSQYVPIGKARRSRNHYGRVWEPEVHWTGGGKFNSLATPPPPPPPHPIVSEMFFKIEIIK